MRGITSYFEGECEVGHAKNWSFGENKFDLLESFGSGISPQKTLSFLYIR